MKFYIESTKYCAEEEELIKNYPSLKEFGYKDKHITVKSLDELMGLANKTECSIILSSDHDVYDRKSNTWIKTGVPSIEIYDWYRE